MLTTSWQFFCSRLNVIDPVDVYDKTFSRFLFVRVCLLADADVIRHVIVVDVDAGIQARMWTRVGSCLLSRGLRCAHVYLDARMPIHIVKEDGRVLAHMSTRTGARAHVDSDARALLSMPVCVCAFEWGRPRARAHGDTGVQKLETCCRGCVHAQAYVASNGHLVGSMWMQMGTFSSACGRQFMCDRARSKRETDMRAFIDTRGVLNTAWKHFTEHENLILTNTEIVFSSYHHNQCLWMDICSMLTWIILRNSIKLRTLTT